MRKRQQCHIHTWGIQILSLSSKILKHSMQLSAMAKRNSKVRMDCNSWQCIEPAALGRINANLMHHKREIYTSSKLPSFWVHQFLISFFRVLGFTLDPKPKTLQWMVQANHQPKHKKHNQFTKLLESNCMSLMSKLREIVLKSQNFLAYENSAFKHSLSNLSELLWDKLTTTES
jgi:hypothetical protein